MKEQEPEFLLHIDVMDDKQNIPFVNIFRECSISRSLQFWNFYYLGQLASSFGDFQNFKSPLYYQANLNS